MAKRLIATTTTKRICDRTFECRLCILFIFIHIQHTTWKQRFKVDSLDQTCSEDVLILKLTYFWNENVYHFPFLGISSLSHSRSKPVCRKFPSNIFVFRLTIVTVVLLQFIHRVWVAVYKTHLDIERFVVNFLLLVFFSFFLSVLFVFFHSIFKNSWLFCLWLCRLEEYERANIMLNHYYCVFEKRKEFSYFVKTPILHLFLFTRDFTALITDLECKEWIIFNKWKPNWK